MLKKQSYVLICTALLIFTLASTAFARNASWSDRCYDFSKAKTIIVDDIRCDIKGMDSIQLRKVEDKCWKAAESTKLVLLDRYNAEKKIASIANISLDDTVGMQEAWGRYAGTIADLIIVPSLDEYNYWNEHIPAYTSMETKYITEKVRLPDGREVIRTREILVPVYHPPQDIPHFDVKMSFKVYDAVTNEMVMDKEDERGKATGDPIGMLGRMTNDFFKDLKKNMKK